MITKRGFIYGMASLLLISGWFLLRGCNKHTDQTISSQILKPEDAAKIIVDPRHHTIVTVTREGTKATFLPRGGASVTIGKSGSIRTNARSWGTEVSPFVGGSFGVDIKLRAATGLNLFYWTRWELGAGLLSGGLKDTRLFMHVSYNPYDNWYLALGVDNRATAHLMAGLKF